MNTSPQVGDFIRCRLGEVQVVRVRPFGTFDVRLPSTDRYYRLTGLHGAAWSAQGGYHSAPGSNDAPTIFSAD